LIHLAPLWEYIDFTKSHVDKNLGFGLAPVP
jgi:hypothetical protein